MDGHEKVASFVLDQVEAKGVYQIIYILGGVGRARVTCTGSCIVNIFIEPQGPYVDQSPKIIKIINRSTNFINELLNMHFVTVMSPVRRLKKLFSYYSII